MSIVTIEHFKVKKKLIGGYKVIYKCPYCSETLISQESELGTVEECPNCEGEFRISDSAISTIDSLKKQSGVRNISETNEGGYLEHTDQEISDEVNCISKDELNFNKQVPPDEVRQIKSGYESSWITAHYEIYKTGSYLFVGGIVGQKDEKGFDTFFAKMCAEKWVFGTEGEILKIDLPLEITVDHEPTGEFSEINWATGVYRSYLDVPFSYAPPVKKKSSNFYTNTGRPSYSSSDRPTFSDAFYDTIYAMWYKCQEFYPYFVMTVMAICFGGLILVNIFQDDSAARKRDFDELIKLRAERKAYEREQEKIERYIELRSIIESEFPSQSE